MLRALRRNPSPPEPKIKRRTNASFFCPRSADAVGRAANFRANFHGAAAKLNALQAFNAPTCHGNSRNGGLRPRATADAQRTTQSAPPWWRLDRCVGISGAGKVRIDGAAPRWSRLAPMLRDGTIVRPKRRQQKGRLSLYAVADAFRRRGLRRRGGGLTAAIRF